MTAGVFVLFILLLGHQFNAIEGSPVNDLYYETMFSNSWRIVASSMIAYIFAQLIDVRVYHFWKKQTNGKHLWLRNNGSTIFSQLIDTTLVVLVLFLGVKSSDELFNFILDGWMFKAFAALLDTPIFYLIVFVLRRYFGLKGSNELNY